KDRARGRVDDRDGVLAAVRDEHALAVGRTDDVPRLGSGGEIGDDTRAERAPSRVADLNDGDGVAGGVGYIGPLVIGREGDALGFIADGDLCQARVVVGTNNADRVVARVH